MKILTMPQGWYPDDINSRLNFDEFNTNCDEEILLVGIACVENPDLRSYYADYERKVYINLEHPCSLYSGYKELDPLAQQQLFDEVYSICPYTCEWLNQMRVGTTFIPMPYPHNKVYDEYHDFPKKIDVSYCGLIHNEEIASYVDILAKHNYFFSTIPHFNKVKSVNALATHSNIPNLNKWHILAHSKINVVQNNLYLNPEQINNIKKLPEWKNNEAFSHLDTGLLPQLKSRTVEGALCKNVMLVKKDPWNVIEEWFVEGEDFIYFSNTEELDRHINEIKNNWSTYEPMALNAYKKVIEKYNTQFIYDKISKQEGIK